MSVNRLVELAAAGAHQLSILPIPGAILSLQNDPGKPRNLRATVGARREACRRSPTQGGCALGPHGRDKPGFDLRWSSKYKKYALLGRVGGSDKVQAVVEATQVAPH